MSIIQIHTKLGARAQIFISICSTQLHKDTAFNLDTVNSPGLATILRHQIAGSACCALGVGVVGVSNIHDDLGVDVLVRGVGATGGSLAFSCSPPALGDAGVCSRRQMCFEDLRDARKTYQMRV